MQEYVTLSNLEIEENVIGSSNFLYTEPEQEYNLIGLRPTIEMPQEQQTIDTTIGPISLNFNQSCLEPDQVPQNIRQSLRSLPNDSQSVKKHVCPEQGCPKSITGYTQSHNLKDHMRKKHNSI